MRRTAGLPGLMHRRLHEDANLHSTARRVNPRSHSSILTGFALRKLNSKPGLHAAEESFVLAPPGVIQAGRVVAFEQTVLLTIGIRCAVALRAGARAGCAARLTLCLFELLVGFMEA